MKKNYFSLYLKKHAEDKAVAIGHAFPKSLLFEHALVIPAYNEDISFLKRLKESSLSQASLLVIVVINQPDNIETTTYNKQLWLDSIKSGISVSRGEDYNLLHWSNTQTHLLIIDCFSQKKCLPSKQGVGLARKIGCDIACSLIEKKNVNTQWVHTSDADTELTNDYLSATPKETSFSAAIYPFRHTSHEPTTEHDPTLRPIIEATLLYEKTLNYYVDGLSYAGSPYAHHSLGSCIAFNAEAYTQVRGFPKRAGGEDFYLLNKLRKLGPIKKISNKPLLISARSSDRVSFGTGPAIKKIIDDKLTIDNYKYYNPKVFVHLKTVLIHFESLFLHKSDPKDWLKKLPQACQKGLIEIGINSLFSHIEIHASNNEKCSQQIQEWFDAFKTLKLIHFLDKIYGRVLLKDAVKKLSESSKIQLPSKVNGF